MIPYRFLSPAEEEMTEAALFYEQASEGLGSDFLDDIQRAVDGLSDYPHSGEPIDSRLRRTLLHGFASKVDHAKLFGRTSATKRHKVRKNSKT